MRLRPRRDDTDGRGRRRCARASIPRNPFELSLPADIASICRGHPSARIRRIQ